MTTSLCLTAKVALPLSWSLSRLQPWRLVGPNELGDAAQLRNLRLYDPDGCTSRIFRGLNNANQAARAAYSGVRDLLNYSSGAIREDGSIA